MLHFSLAISCDTVDGSEIRRSPVEVGSLSHQHLFTWFFTSLCGFLARFLDHQQYLTIFPACPIGSMYDIPT